MITASVSPMGGAYPSPLVARSDTGISTTTIPAMPRTAGSTTSSRIRSAIIHRGHLRCTAGMARMVAATTHDTTSARITCADLGLFQVLLHIRKAVDEYLELGGFIDSGMQQQTRLHSRAGGGQGE